MNTQPIGYQPVARETVYSTLATRLLNGMGLSKVYRARRNIADENANLSPLGWLVQVTSDGIKAREQLPTRYKELALFCCGIAQQTLDPNFVASTQVNIYRDLLDAALTPDVPMDSRCTLGGIIDYVRPVRTVYFETLQNDIWTGFTCTIEMLYTPLNLV